MELNPDDLAPADRYKLLIGCIVPQPIAFVSTVSPWRSTAGRSPAPPSRCRMARASWSWSGLTPAPCTVVKPPRVAESPFAFECETVQVVRTNPGQPGGGNVVIGRVVHVHLRDDLVDERLHVDYEVLRSIGRMGGLGYTTTRDRFEMPMGRGALTD